MRGSYCTSNWFYGLIAVFYQSRHLKDVKQLHLSHPPASLNPSATVSVGGLVGPGSRRAQLHAV